jgi:hypothetical protein
VICVDSDCLIYSKPAYMPVTWIETIGFKCPK